MVRQKIPWFNSKLITKGENMKVIVNGHEFDADAVANLMDDEIREKLHSIGYENEQEFVNAYCLEHEKKFGEEFIVN